MRLTLLRLLLPLFLLALAGCSTTSSCGGNDEYLTAVERPRLQLPPDVMASERIAPVTIPSLAPDTARLDPEPRCLDYPPPYFARKAGVADSAEAAVQAWAAAWAARDGSAVARLYSPSFEAPGEGGGTAYLDQRRQEVASGPAPSPRLEDMSVTTLGADRRTVTFTQVFGDQRVRREQTLVREGEAWRIVAERTL
jgi:hypothetical protein